jgi:hypothetical protein
VSSTVLLWQHRLGLGLALHYGLPLLRSYAVLRVVDVQSLRRTRRGRYVLAHTPPAAQGVRLVGDAVACGSWRRRPGDRRRMCHRRRGLVRWAVPREPAASVMTKKSRPGLAVHDP